MEYKVLYRKYRPHDFNSLIGQEWVSKLLRNTIINNKISHAYIFTGPRGTGKTSSARIFAKAINCEHPIDGNPCNECEMCRNFDNNPDIIEIDAASNNGVDEVRELINNIKLAPTSSKYKVYIVDEFHMLSTSAFNALLLTLEEPPSNIVFILATTDIQSVPITIISRCQRFDFKPINDELLANHLKNVAEKENIKISDAALKEIALLANGGVRDALGMLDQISSQVENIEIDDVTNLFGTISTEKVENLINTLESNNIDEMLGILKEFKNSGINYQILIKKIINALKERIIALRKGTYKGNLEFDSLYNLILDVNKCISENKNALTTYDLLEVIFLKYNYFPGNKIEKYKEEKKEVIVKEEQPKEEKNNDNVNIDEQPIVKSNKLNVDIRINNCFVNAKKNYLTSIQSKWSDFIIYEANANKSLMAFIADTEPVAASDKYCIVSNKIETNNDLLNDKIELLEKDMSKFYGMEYKVVAVSENKWKKVKEEYVNNLKTGYKYNYIEESEIVKESDENVSDLEVLANEIFGNNGYQVE